MRVVIAALFLLGLIFVEATAMAQAPPANGSPNQGTTGAAPARSTEVEAPLPNPPPASPASASGLHPQQVSWGFLSKLTPYELVLTLVIVGFGLLNVALVLFLFRGSIAVHAELVLRYLIVVTIVTATLVLITAGYSNEQVAPAFGLFGAIVGYILGRLAERGGKGGESPPVHSPDRGPPPIPPGGV